MEGLILIYVFFSLLIFNEMYKEGKRLKKDNEELIKEVETLKWQVEDLMENFVPKYPK